jgi:hypothetical protein
LRFQPENAAGLKQLLQRAHWIATAAGAVAILLSMSSAATAQSRSYRALPAARTTLLAYDNDPAPQWMEPAEEIDGPMLDESGSRSRMPSSRVRRRAEYANGQSPGAASRAPGRGPWIVSDDGKYIPYDPGLQPGGEFLSQPPCGEPCGSQPHCPLSQACPPSPQGPCTYTGCPPVTGADCDESYDGHLTWLHDWYENSCLYCPEFWRNFNEFSGIQAFKGPPDLGRNGNFGFHKAVNWATPLFPSLGIGYQLGALIALSDFEGKSGPFGTSREQYFVTTGLFRRATNNLGWQGGATVDYLHDEFYVNMNVMQIRGELSYICRCGHEVGIWTATNVLHDNQTAPAFVGTPSVTWWTVNQYNPFYRRRFNNGATARFWIGVTDQANVTFGSDATAVLAERWAIQASYNYLLPCTGSSIPRDVRESFGLAISLVWYPGYKVPNACFNAYRPLFMVADNSSMFIRTN